MHITPSEDNPAEISKCTRCNKPLTSTKSYVGLTINSYRKTSKNAWEKIANLESQTKEILCEECFDKFLKLIERMNE